MGTSNIAVANSEELKDYSLQTSNFERHYKLFSPPLEATDKKSH
jgi:hypothetical protein